MAKVCDKCNKKATLNLINIKGKSYELCNQCVDKIIKQINPKKSKEPGFLDRLKDNLESLNGVK